MTPDAEDKKLLTDAEHVQNMLQSQGWGVVKGKLDTLILDLQNINNIDMERPDTLSVQLAARKMAVDLIFGWLKRDVYGFVEQQRANQVPPNEADESIIERHN